MNEKRSTKATSPPLGERGLLPFLRHWIQSVRDCVGWRLVLILTFILIVFLSGAGVFIDRMQRRHMVDFLEDMARGMGSVALATMHSAMLENNRKLLEEMIDHIGQQDQILAVRVVAAGGAVCCSSRKEDLGKIADITAGPCKTCHLGDRTLVPRSTQEGLQVYHLSEENQALGMAIPILNEPACYNAACHVHSPEQAVLGILDLELSTAHLDAAVHEQQRQYRILSALMVMTLCVVVGVSAWRVVHRPVHALLDGTRRIAAGDLSFRLPPQSVGEVHELASSFNMMAEELEAAHRDLEKWNRTLEDRVAEKSHQLERAHDQLVLTEKMVSLGKLSAVVAHEINNPLAGVLVTVKLLHRRLPKLISGELDEEVIKDTEAKLDLVEKETARCGDIVRNLLLFSRQQSVEAQPEQLEVIAERCLKLVGHQAELQQVRIHKEFEEGLPPVECDANQIEQACLVMVMNALDAMPDGGDLTVRITDLPPQKMVRVEVVDTGPGIPEEIRSRIFEPFFSTKESGKGTGLGLAVLYGIVHRHHGHVDFRSATGKGTTFWMDLPHHPPDLDPQVPNSDFNLKREVIDS